MQANWLKTVKLYEIGSSIRIRISKQPFQELCSLAGLMHMHSVEHVQVLNHQKNVNICDMQQNSVNSLPEILNYREITFFKNQQCILTQFAYIGKFLIFSTFTTANTSVGNKGVPLAWRKYH